MKEIQINFINIINLLDINEIFKNMNTLLQNQVGAHAPKDPT